MRPAVLLVVSLVLSGCGAGAVGLCEAQVRASCELQYRCCSAEERLQNTLVFGFFFANTYATSEGECVERAAGVCKAFLSSTDEAAAAGRLRVDGERANECIAALNAARDECDINAFLEAKDAEGAECDGIVEGLVEDGDECAGDNECAGDGFCDFGDPGDPQVDEELGTRVGSCIDGGAGDDCSADPTLCDEDLFCRFEDQTCVDRPGAGEPCPDFVCDRNFECGVGGTCQALPGEGEPCTLNCVEGFFCNATCAPQLAPGEECVGFANECAGGAFCVDNVCEGGDAPVPLDICEG